MLGFGLSACSTSKVVGPSVYGARTDYVMGRVYTLNKPVFLFKYDKSDSREIAYLEELGFSGTPSNLADFVKQAPGNPQVAGVLLPGDHIRVVKFVENKSITLGNFLDVISIVVSGKNNGAMVRLSMISKERQPSYSVFVDPEYLKRVEAP